MLAGEKVKLRPIQRSDIETALAMVNDPEVRQYLYMRWPLSRQEEEEWYARTSDGRRDGLVFAIVDRKGKHVGVVGLHNIDYSSNKAVLGIQIGDRTSQNKGYGREALALVLGFAFDELNLDLVQLETFDFNARAQRCYLASGFKEEGWQRSKIFNLGKRRDLLQMSVTRDDWLKMRKRK